MSSIWGTPFWQSGDLRRLLAADSIGMSVEDRIEAKPKSQQECSCEAMPLTVGFARYVNWPGTAQQANGEPKLPAIFLTLLRSLFEEALLQLLR